jgi:hypothetical protein
MTAAIELTQRNQRRLKLLMPCSFTTENNRVVLRQTIYFE